MGLFEDEAGIRAKVRAAVTDTGVLPPGTEMSEGVENLFGILRACGRKDEAEALLADYNAGNRQYSRLKGPWPTRWWSSPVRCAPAARA